MEEVKNDAFDLEYPSFIKDVDREKNAQNIQNLRDILLNHKTLAFVGAGISSLAGFCDWGTLINDFKNEYIKLCKNASCKHKAELKCLEETNVTKLSQPNCLMRKLLEKDIEFQNEEDYYLLIAQFLKDEFFEFKQKKSVEKNIYNDLLSKNFSKVSSSEEILRKIALLPVSGFVTTNYETALDNAINLYNSQYDERFNRNFLSTCINFHNDSSSIQKFKDSIKSNEKKVLHIHGIYNNPETIVLAKEDYKKAYNIIEDEDLKKGRLGDIRKLILDLGLILNNYNTIFMGFGFRDIATNSILKLNYKREENKKNYAIMNLSNLSDIGRFKELEEYYGLNIIFYYTPSINDDSKRKDYKTNLNKLLDILYQQPSLEVKNEESSVMEDKNEIMQKNSIDSILTKYEKLATSKEGENTKDE